MFSRCLNSWRYVVVCLTIGFFVLQPLVTPLAQAESFDTPVGNWGSPFGESLNPGSGGLNFPDTGGDVNLDYDYNDFLFDQSNDDDLQFIDPSVNNAIGGATDTDGDGVISTEEANASPQGENNPSTAAQVSMAQVLAEKTGYKMIISLGGVIAGIAGWLLDTAIKYLVAGMGCWFVEGASGCELGNGYVGGVVNQLWTLIRDLMNILFIFGLVYLGIRLILFSDDSSTQRSIGLLLAAAFLVNFSLYIAKVILDITNFTAVTILDQATQNIEGGNTASFFPNYDGSLTGAFMDVLFITSWFAEGAGDGIVFAIMAFIFMLILAAVFFYGAIMLIARFVAIIILLIFSPVMFIGWILPSFRSYSSKWLKMFVSYCFFAPAFVFMIYLALYTLFQIQQSMLGVIGEDVNYAKLFADGAVYEQSEFSIFLFFAIGIGFLFAATKVSNLMSAAGAGATMNMAGGFARKMSLGAVALGGGYVGNSLAGGLGNRIRDYSENREVKRGGTSNAYTRGVRSLGENLRSKKFGGASSIADREKAQKEGNRRAAGLKATSDARVALKAAGSNPIKIQEALAKMDKADVIAWSKTDEGRKTLVANAEHLSPDVVKALTDDKEQDRTAVGAIQGARRQAAKKSLTAPDSIKTLNKDKRAALDYDTLKEPDNVVHLDDDKIKDLPLVEAQKDMLKEERKKAYIEIAKGTPHGKITATDLARKKPDFLAKLPKEVFNESGFVDSIPAQTIKSKPFAEMEFEKQEKVRTKLDTAISTGARPLNQRLTDIEKWLQSPQGQSFGKS